MEEFHKFGQYYGLSEICLDKERFRYGRNQNLGGKK